PAPSPSDRSARGASLSSFPDGRPPGGAPALSVEGSDPNLAASERLLARSREAAMGGRVALFLAWVLPLASVAQEVVEEEGSESRDSGGEVAGGPLDLSHLGQRPRPDGIEAASPFEYDPHWGLKESEFRLVPAGSARPRTEPEFARIPVPRWPGPAMVEAWDLGAAYTFPRLAPAIGAELFSFAGERRDQTVFGERVRLSFYFVELAFDAVGSVGGERIDRTDLDLDFRIPIRLGRKH